MSRRAELARTWRTTRTLRPAQWTARARRLVLAWLDRFAPGPARAAAAYGATAIWREGWHPAWPHLEVGAGHGDVGRILAGTLDLHGRSVPVAPGSLPWGSGDSLLWQFQLHAFDFAEPLLGGGPAAVGWLREAVDSWIAQVPPPSSPGWGPYCTSRRVARWLPLLSAHPAEGDEARVASLGAQLERLSRRVEHDLQGNHLWENAVALCLGGAAFEGPVAAGWRRVGTPLLARVLTEQVLDRGGHAERSAMYHAILLEGLLGLLAAQQARGVVDAPLERVIRRMTRWLLLVTGPGGRIPMINDVAPGVAASTASLAAAAAALGVRADPAAEGAWNLDGWLIVRDGHHHLVFDAARVGLPEQPGHAHAGTLGLELTVGGRPVVVDPGTAGYAEDPHRGWSRSTAAHGTVALDGHDSAELWSTFRMGRRPGYVRDVGPEPLDSPVGRAWRLGGEHDGYAWLEGEPLVAREVVLWVLGPAAAVLWVSDRVRGSARELASRVPLAAGLGWNAVTGAIDGGALVPFGFDRVAAVEGRVSAGFGRWEASTVPTGFAPAGAPTGWVLGVGVALDVGHDVRIRYQGDVVGALPRPDRAPAITGIAPIPPG